MKIVDRRLLFERSSFICPDAFSHTSNPVLVKQNNLTRLFFNMRDNFQKSSVFSVDLNHNDLSILPDTFKVQYLVDSSTPSYCSQGVSLGGFNDSKFTIGFMGWHAITGGHWKGLIGELKLDNELDLRSIDNTPIQIPIDSESISFSYPCYVNYEKKQYMWFGATVTWEAGNGEMLHVLRRRDVNARINDYEIPYKLNLRQAFSRPSIASVGTHSILAYSFRGNIDKYRIGFNYLDSMGLPISDHPDYIMEPSKNKWENEMVAYPYLFTHADKIMMLYNGNSYGKTGIGLAEIEID